jgi:hypothetical protein
MEYIRVAESEEDELMGKYKIVAIDEDSSVSSDSVKSALGGVLTVENLKFRAGGGMWNNLVIRAGNKIAAGISGWKNVIYVAVHPNSGKYTAVLLKYFEFKFPEIILPSLKIKCCLNEQYLISRFGFVLNAVLPNSHFFT